VGYGSLCVGRGRLASGTFALLAAILAMLTWRSMFGLGGDVSETKIDKPTKCAGCDESLNGQLNSAYVPVTNSKGESQLETFYLCDGCYGAIPEDAAGRTAFLERLVVKRYSDRPIIKEKY
jgi:hypothetical protein